MLLKRRIWIGLAIVSVAALVVVCTAGGMMLCETSLHVPRKLPPATPSGIAPHWRPVEMTARDGAVLKAWLLSPATANGDCVMTLHGIPASPPRNGRPPAPVLRESLTGAVPPPPAPRRTPRS